MGDFPGERVGELLSKVWSTTKRLDRMLTLWVLSPKVEPIELLRFWDTGNKGIFRTTTRASLVENTWTFTRAHLRTSATAKKSYFTSTIASMEHWPAELFYVVNWPLWVSPKDSVGGCNIWSSLWPVCCPPSNVIYIMRHHHIILLNILCWHNA